MCTECGKNPETQEKKRYLITFFTTYTSLAHVYSHRIAWSQLSVYRYCHDTRTVVLIFIFLSPVVCIHKDVFSEWWIQLFPCLRKQIVHFLWRWTSQWLTSSWTKPRSLLPARAAARVSTAPPHGHPPLTNLLVLLLPMAQHHAWMQAFYIRLNWKWIKRSLCL